MQEEQTVIEGKFKINKLSKVLLICGISAILIWAVWFECHYLWGYHARGFYHGRHPRLFSEYIEDIFSLEWFCNSPRGAFEDLLINIFLYSGVLCCLLSLYFKIRMSKCSITVTSKRVFGNADFHKKVSIALNQISSITLSSFSSITVSSSSKVVHFWFVDNRDEVFEKLSNMIDEYHVNKADVRNGGSSLESNTSPAGELLKYGQLLEQGLITQEEYETKKKQLLNL